MDAKVKKTLIISAIVIAVVIIAEVAFLIYSKNKKHPQITIGDLILCQFGDKNAVTMGENTTVGEFIKQCMSLPHETAFTVEWFCENNPGFENSNAATLIPAGTRVYYPK